MQYERFYFFAQATLYNKQCLVRNLWSLTKLSIACIDRWTNQQTMLFCYIYEFMIMSIFININYHGIWDCFKSVKYSVCNEWSWWFQPIFWLGFFFVWLSSIIQKMGEREKKGERKKNPVQHMQFMKYAIQQFHSHIHIRNHISYNKTYVAYIAISAVLKSNWMHIQRIWASHIVFDGVVVAIFFLCVLRIAPDFIDETREKWWLRRAVNNKNNAFWK